jgi:hypothetical protein
LNKVKQKKLRKIKTTKLLLKLETARAGSYNRVRQGIAILTIRFVTKFQLAQEQQEI